MAQYFTDFSGLTTGVIAPGWTKQYNTTNNNWIVTTLASSDDNAVFRQTIPSGNANKAVSWDDPTADADRANCEILVRMMISAIDASNPYLILRGSGTATASTQTNFQLEFTTAEVALIRKLNGATTYLATYTTFIPTSNQWFWARFRANGSTIQAKIWADGSAEPTSWAMSVNNTGIPGAGFIGMGAFYADVFNVYYDQIGVGTNGDTALASGTTVLTVTATGIAPASDLGAPTVIQGAAPSSITATGFASASALGSPTVARGAVSFTTTGIGSTAAIGSPTLSNKATITATGIASAAAIGRPLIGSGFVSPSGIAAASALGGPTVARGSVSVTLTGKGSTALIGTPRIGRKIQFTGIAGTASLGALSVQIGAAPVSPAGISPAGGIGQPTVTISAARISPSGVSPSGMIGRPTVNRGAVTVTMTGIASQLVIFPIAAGLDFDLFKEIFTVTVQKRATYTATLAKKVSQTAYITKAGHFTARTVQKQVIFSPKIAAHVRLTAQMEGDEIETG